LSQHNNLTAFSASQKLLCRHKNQFYWMQIMLLSGTKCLWLTQYVNKFLVRLKKFGPAQNILHHLKGQGKSKQESTKLNAISLRSINEKQKKRS
jgi:hypothetical protein